MRAAKTAFEITLCFAAAGCSDDSTEQPRRVRHSARGGTDVGVPAAGSGGIGSLVAGAGAGGVAGGRTVDVVGGAAAAMGGGSAGAGEASVGGWQGQETSCCAGGSAGQGSGGSAVVAAGAGGAEACEEVSFSASAPEAVAWQADISRRIAEGPDCNTSTDAACAMAPRPLDHGSAWCASVGRRILHIDGFGYYNLERSHGRILNYLKADPDRGYVEWIPQVNMQQGRFALDQEIGRVAFSLEGLTAALATLNEKNPLLTPNPEHGDYLMRVTHRLSPRTQSVLAEYPSIDCDPEVAQRSMRRRVAALTDVVARYGVRYIVMSAGVTRRHFEHCPGDPDQLLRQQLDEFYAPLANIPGAIFIQSAVDKTETVRALTLNDPEYLVDCTPIPGRIRVSYAAIPKRDVPPEGLPYSAFRDALSADSQNTAACVDAFVAFFDQDPDFMGTSFVPPYVAAMAIAAENKAPERLGAANSERAAQLIGEGAPRLFEPRSNHQFESF